MAEVCRGEQLGKVVAGGDISLRSLEHETDTEERLQQAMANNVLNKRDRMGEIVKEQAGSIQEIKWI